MNLTHEISGTVPTTQVIHTLNIVSEQVLQLHHIMGSQPDGKLNE